MVVWSIFKNSIEEPLNSNDAYIICPNHVSSLDIPIVLAAFKIPVISWQKKSTQIFQYLDTSIRTIPLLLIEITYVMHILHLPIL